MNHLLRTLSSSHIQTQPPDQNLRLLLTTVRDGRANDPKLSDPFYDSLEGLLHDLRTVTVDNHDAEAFLKPVSRSEVPDYYQVIPHPMDLQTMLKKVKARTYKSKKEFRDDLELIWSNCLMYNATEGHPLRECARRLKRKADVLLSGITDRRERLDGGKGELGGQSATSTATKPGISIKLNGHTTISLPPKTGLAVPLPKKAPARRVEFSDQPALIRTQDGMRSWLDVEAAVGQWEITTLTPQSGEQGQETPGSRLVQLLEQYRPPMRTIEEEDPEPSVKQEDVSEPVPGGLKRRQNGTFDSHRPRKRTRYIEKSLVPIPIAPAPSPTGGGLEAEVLATWWGAIQSDTLIANAMPNIPGGMRSSAPTTSGIIAPGPKGKSRTRKKTAPTSPKKDTKALLSAMNSNIRTMKGVRRTHAKFVALGFGDDLGPSGPSASGGDGIPAVTSLEDEAGIEDNVDEVSWIERAGLRRSRSHAAQDQDDRLELGQEKADDCLRWMGSKVLEHAGFQGTSRVALDMLTSVAGEYLMNVGRTIRYLGDKSYGKGMGAEEIILHTLFESGVSKPQDLERYITDDVERYGARLVDLEKKLVGAYRDTVSKLSASLDGLEQEEEDEGLFADDEDGALATGDLAESLGVDFFGFREMGGLLDELGLGGTGTLVIPRALLRAKRRRRGGVVAKPKEPPPPFPPPPSFVPLTMETVPEQIGLLTGYYLGRLETMAAATTPRLSLPGPTLPATPSFILPPLAGPRLHPPAPSAVMVNGSSLTGSAHTPSQDSPTAQLPVPVEISTAPPLPPPPPVIAPYTILPDDLPTPAQMKMSPLGHIMKIWTSGGHAGSGGGGGSKSKKKSKTGEKAPGAGTAQGGGIEASALEKKKSGTTAPTKKKKDGMGNGPPHLLLPPVVTASA